jgi:DNA polymerase III alpha subunit
LIFERFIDTTRSDLPDIDLDFSDQKRHLVFEYMEQKYGAKRVARLGTVAVYKPRSAIAEAAAALDIPRWRTDKILDSLIERSSGDSRALQVMEDTFTDTPAGKALIEEFPELVIAQRMEGHPRHSSQHAAGIVLTEEDVGNYVAVDARTGATHCDKKDAEELNLLKIDALGLTQLSVFEDALQMAGLPMDALEHIPLDDQQAFDVINKGQFSGIFQYNGIALQSIANQINTSSLEDIVSTTALARPGPMASGGTNEWVKRKRGDHPVVYQHEAFEPYLRNTMGIVCYQEQVMEICRQIGDLSWGDVTALRKAMSKSLGKEFFDQYGDRWKEGARKKGIPNEVLDKTWDDLCAYGAWAFNRSHSVAYGLVSYWCCWLKAHHPFEFAAATLQHETDPVKQIQLLREMHAEGIDYVPVDKDKSTDRWQASIVNGKKVLLGPVQNVKGIGPKKVAQIVSARARGEPLPSSIAKLLEDPKTDIDSLWRIRDAFNRLMPDPAARNIHTKPTQIIDVQTVGADYDVLVFGVAKQIKPKDENEAVNVAKRGYKLNGPTAALNLWIMDDTDTIYCKINRYDFERLGKEIVDRGKPGKALYAIKGTVPPDFRMIRVSQVRYIGDMDDGLYRNEKNTQKLMAGEQA